MGVNCEISHPVTGKAIPRDYVERLEQRAQNIERELTLCGFPNLMPSDEVDISLWGRCSGPQIARLICSRLWSRSLEVPQSTIPKFEKYLGHTSQNVARLPRLPAKFDTEKMLIRFIETIYPHFPCIDLDVLIGEHYMSIYGPPDSLLVSKYPEVTNIRYDHLSPNFASDSSRYPEKDIFFNPSDTKSRGSLYYLLMIMAITTAGDIRQYHECEKYYAHAILYFQAVSNTADTLEWFTALLFLGLYSLARPTRPGAWQLNSLITNMCIERGLHVMGKEKPSSGTNWRHRRRVLLCSYLFDKFVSFIFGRPSLMHELGINNQDLFSHKYMFPRPKEPGCDLFSVEMSTVKTTKYFLDILCIQDEIKYMFYEKPRILEIPIDELIEIRNHYVLRVKALHKAYRQELIYLSAINLPLVRIIYHNSILLLAGFSEFLPEPDDSELTAVLVACEGIITEYCSLHNQKDLTVTWAALSLLTFAATAGVYSLWRLIQVGSLSSEYVQKWNALLSEVWTLLLLLKEPIPSVYNLLKLLEVPNEFLAKLISLGV